MVQVHRHQMVCRVLDGAKAPACPAGLGKAGKASSLIAPVVDQIIKFSVSQNVIRNIDLITEP